MMQFIIGAVVGSILSFVVFAIVSSSSDKIYSQEDMDAVKQREREKQLRGVS